MFVSFFPQPKLFFTLGRRLESLSRCCSGSSAASSSAPRFGMPPAAADARADRRQPVLLDAGIPLVLHLFRARASALFYAFWCVLSRRIPGQHWSILGIGADLCSSPISTVQVSVAINNWRGPFYDLVQQALTTPGSVHGRRSLRPDLHLRLDRLRRHVAVVVVTRFFVSHYIFRWRTAMNDYYMANWPQLRHIEGASQRVQEDTMRFSQTMRGPRRQPRRFGHDADRLPAAARAAVGARHRTADRRRDPVSAGVRRDLLVAVRHRAAGRRRHQAAGPASSATSASRRPTARNWSMARTTPTGRSRRPSPSCSPMCARTISRSISTTSISTSRATLYLQADNIFAYADPGADHRRRQDHASASAADL